MQLICIKNTARTCEYSRRLQGKSENTRHQFSTIDEYIKTFPEDVQVILEKIRQTIRKAAPEAEETISYKMPAFNLNGKYLIYLAANKHHISIYPIPAGTRSFEKELSPYIKGKGKLQFPLNKPVPYDLVEEIVRFRAKENLAKKK